MKIIEKTFNVLTGEETFLERDETAVETKARLNFEKAQNDAKTQSETKEAAKAALLVKLGITADEAKLLLS